METSIQTLITYLKSKQYEINDEFETDISNGCKKAFSVKKVEKVTKKTRKVSTKPPYWNAFGGYIQTALSKKIPKLGKRSKIAGALWQDFKKMEAYKAEYDHYIRCFEQEMNGKTKKLLEEPAKIVEQYMQEHWEEKLKLLEKKEEEEKGEKDGEKDEEEEADE